MTIDDYKRNLRGVNNGSDFSAEFLVRGDLFPPNFIHVAAAKYLRLDSQTRNCYAGRTYGTARV